MHETPSLFTELDLAALQTPLYGVGSFIRIRGFQQARIVAQDPHNAAYWLVKLAGGQIVSERGDSFS